MMTGMIILLATRLVALVTLVSAIEKTGYLNRKENDYIQRICGTKNWLPDKYAEDKSLHKSMNSDSTAPYDAPWAVAVYNDKRQLGCSGVLISYRHVLTAAHCVQYNSMVVRVDRDEAPHKRKPMVQMETEAPNNIRVVIGDYCAEANANAGCVPNLISRVVRKVGRLWVHANYNRNDTSDIAILELACSVELPGVHIIPICLGDSPIQMRQTMSIYSYGREGVKDPDQKRDTLQGIKENVVDCLEDTSPPRDMLLRTNDFCTISDDPEKKQATCQGDSGAGVVSGLDNNKRTHLYGIVSGGNACTLGRILTNFVYTDHHTLVRPFISWIARKTGVCPKGHSCENEPRRLETDEDGDMIIGSKTQTLMCEDESWLLSTKGTRALCYKTTWWNDMKFTATQAEEKCKEMFKGQLAPVRNEAELYTLREAIPKSGYRPAQNTAATVTVGGFWDVHDKLFRWNIDHSKALRDRGHIRMWSGDGNSTDANGRETHCLAVRVQYDLPRLTEISCDFQSPIIACVTEPRSIITYPSPPVEPVCPQQ